MNGLIRWLRGNSVGAALVETIIALRPAWWIARAWIAVELVGMFFSAQWFPLPTFTGRRSFSRWLSSFRSGWAGELPATGRRQANMSSCSSGTSWPCWGWQLSSEHWQAAARLVTTTSSTVRMPPSLELLRLVRSTRTARRSPTCILRRRRRAARERPPVRPGRPPVHEREVRRVHVRQHDGRAEAGGAAQRLPTAIQLVWRCAQGRMHRPGNRSAVWRDLARHLLGYHADAVGQCFASTKPGVHANRSARFVAEAITRPVRTSPGLQAW